MKKFLFLIIFASVSLFVYSQEVDEFNLSIDNSYNENADAFSEISDSNETENSTDEFDEFDSLFAEAEDVVVEEKTTPPTPVVSSPNQSIKFTGALEAGLGGGVSISPADYFKPQGYLSLTHYTYMSARASDIFGIKGSIQTSFPNFSLSLHEIYFDYLLLDFLYIQAGKKVITWGNTELIEHNILSDAVNGASIGISFNLFNTNFSGIVLSQISWGGGAVPGFSNLSFAGSIERVFGKLQLNLFGRKWASEDSNHKNPVIGLESKINLWGFDLYNQTISHIKFDFDKFENTQFDRLYFTVGLMKDWDTPRIGFIVEYQWIYYDKILNPTMKDSHKLYFKGLVSRLFKSTSKIGLEFEHDFVNNIGIVTPGYIYYALPHADVKVGIPIAYSPKTWSIVPAVALSFEWNY